jgi:hypothetical protein
VLGSGVKGSGIRVESLGSKNFCDAIEKQLLCAAGNVAQLPAAPRRLLCLFLSAEDARTPTEDGIMKDSTRCRGLSGVPCSSQAPQSITPYHSKLLYWYTR